MTILTSVWSAQHPNAGRNIQQLLNIVKKFKFRGFEPEITDHPKH